MRVVSDGPAQHGPGVDWTRENVAMPEEERSGVRLTNLDQPLFADAGATKRDLIDYVDAMADRFVPVLAGRALSVVRVLRGQAPFMQKNLPAYAPASIPTLEITTQDGKRVVRYPSATTGKPSCGSPTNGRSSTTRPCSKGGSSTLLRTWSWTSTRPLGPTPSRAPWKPRTWYGKPSTMSVWRPWLRAAAPRACMSSYH